MSRRPAIYQPQTDTYLIPLTRGKSTTVDAVDANLADVLWTAKPDSYTTYAHRHEPLGNGKRKTIRLHREILALMLKRDLLPGEEVDHIDGNGLNNTRKNLRLATKAQNMANSRKRSDNTSGFKGVCWHEQSGKWRAYIMVGGQQIYLGLFPNVDDAHAAYCAAAEIHFGQFANDGGTK